jgi:hypothetical protein
LIWTQKEHNMNFSAHRLKGTVMDELLENSPHRDANGRFQPGQSGNPAGKIPGTRNRATLLREALNEGEDRTVARLVIDKALAGNLVAARFVVGRLMPRPRDRAIELELPAGAGAGDIVAAYDATVQAMMDGEISTEEALTVTRVLDGRLRARKAAAREEAAREQLPPLRKKEPSPARGRGQGEGMGAPAEQDRRGPSAQPSPRPSPVNGRGGFSCIPPAFPRRRAGAAGWRREVGVAAGGPRPHL